MNESRVWVEILQLSRPKGGGGRERETTQVVIVLPRYQLNLFSHFLPPLSFFSPLPLLSLPSVSSPGFERADEPAETKRGVSFPRLSLLRCENNDGNMLFAGDKLSYIAHALCTSTVRGEGGDGGSRGKQKTERGGREVWDARHLKRKIERERESVCERVCVCCDSAAFLLPLSISRSLTVQASHRGFDFSDPAPTSSSSSLVTLSRDPNRFQTHPWQMSREVTFPGDAVCLFLSSFASFVLSTVLLNCFVSQINWHHPSLPPPQGDRLRLRIETCHDTGMMENKVSGLSIVNLSFDTYPRVFPPFLFPFFFFFSFFYISICE
ncbi:hypothetical protein LZ31DRAFT_308672 [Colletotrichum somersetense]|nr:hypothetical protein LZ31DRAFT_308672 [Colletotrichum somersetense]